MPPGAVTKNSINLKITISQELLVEIDPSNFVIECFLCEAF